MELNWGVHDVFTLDNYGTNLLGSRRVIPQLLQLFTRYETHVTWAIVGMLYCKNKKELEERLQNIDITYDDPTLSPYHILKQVGENEWNDPYHYASSLIEMIRKTKNQEVGTHTFTHFYCLEEGQNSADFEKDLLAAREVDQEVTSLVFPRNQTNEDYLKVCERHGILAYRGNEKHWIYKAFNKKNNTPVKRILRLTDAYINLTGHHNYSLSSISTKPIVNIPSSRFLRPYNKRLKVLEGLRLRRIKNGLTYAAKTNSYYHLWWHPHNFGRDITENLLFLEEILKHVDYLKKEYNFQSLHMKDVTDIIKITS